MTVLLGNCLENTCDAVSPSGSVQLNEVGYFPARAFCSMKENGGQGLASLEHTAAKYGGTAEFRFQKPLFYTRISLELIPGAPVSPLMQEHSAAD